MISFIILALYLLWRVTRSPFTCPTRLLSQWMLHWWRVNVSTARQLFPCTQPREPIIMVLMQHYYTLVVFHVSWCFLLYIMQGTTEPKFIPMLLPNLPDCFWPLFLLQRQCRTFSCFSPHRLCLYKHSHCLSRDIIRKSSGMVTFDFVSHGLSTAVVYFTSEHKASNELIRTNLTRVSSHPAKEFLASRQSL